VKFPDHPADPVALEELVLRQWREERLFAQTLRQTEGAEEFVFFEGPPTANGRPGIHHVLSRTLKDFACRFWTMSGRHVTRIAGWDTHGLPVEIEAEKKLGISGKRQIEELGVARFNEVCRESVFTYKENWERLSERIGYWLDYSRPYVTFMPQYIETVWWIFSQLQSRNLLYRGHKSVPYCPRCGTALSSHEVAQGYEDVEDPSLYFVCPFLHGPDGESADGRAFLVWTTTPWTLPANVALALHPALTYAEVEYDGRRLVLAEARVNAVFGPDAHVVRRYDAFQLAGVRYARPFDLVPAPSSEESAWLTVLEEFVSADDGTGIVHLAPAFGADDYASGQRHGLPLFRPVDDAGRFHARLPLVGGMFVKDADAVLVDDLRARGLVFRYGLATHSYPHCWRCDSPLIYMARDSWFLRTTAVRKSMLENNRAVDWQPPEMGSGRFGEWLEGNIDWAISRERYWGTPLPAWVCTANPEHVEVIGSFQQLAERAGALPADFDPHKPSIDEFRWPCAECNGEMRRTPEVIDAWFDSGAMPYAQWHYPFENEDMWRRHFPADFICEGVDQTRGWFYSLMAIATMLDDGPAYRHVVVNDLVLDAQGQKMSKSRGNVVDPWDAIAQFGADAIRWYFLTASQPWVPKRFDPAALGESARRVFDTLANTYHFLALYANLEGWTPSAADPPPAARSVLDRWILSRATTVAAAVHRDFAAYEVTRAARAIGEFIVDDLSNWYVRRSRDRFYGNGDVADTRGAFRTLHDVLVVSARLLAPVTPFHADWFHRALLNGQSVHLAPFPHSDADPDRDRFTREEPLETGMDAVRALSRLGRAARDRVRIRVRQPLHTLHAVVPPHVRLTPELISVLMAELNVKEVKLLSRAEELVRFRAVPNFRTLGKRFGGRTQAAAETIRSLQSERLEAFRKGAPLSIALDGEEHLLTFEELELREEPRGELVVESAGGYTAAIDPRIDETLVLEGLARELVSRIQRLRRELGFDVSDRIRVAVFGPPEVCSAVNAHHSYIARETLAVDLQAHPPGSEDGRTVHAIDLDGIAAGIGLERAGQHAMP
jgi:isoleucyl-tRNA synthetase